MADTEAVTEQPVGDTPPVSPGELRARLAEVDVFSVGLGVIVVLQAVWFAVLMHTGWYYQADFNNLASATGRSLTWSYLSTSQGGHLDIAGRLALWLLNRTIPLNYNATILVRLVAVAAATYLLGRLLRELVGPRRGVLALLALFALSPMLVQSTLWLTSSINFLISELLVLVALRAHVRYAVTRRLRWAVWTAVAMLGATLVAEQAAVTTLMLPVLTFAFLSEGRIRDRLRTVRRSWPEWLLIAVPILAFAAFYFGSGKYATTSKGFGANDAARLVSTFWFHTLVPGLFGGPLSWSTFGGNYFAFSAPTLAIRVIALGLLVLAIAWTVWRTSALALCGWAIPAIVSGVGMVFVGRARYEFFGGFVGLHFEYASYVAVPAAVGIALAIWTTSVPDIRARLESGTVPLEKPARHGRFTRSGRWLGRAIVVGLAVASLISAGTYARAWSGSPSKAYVGRLAASLSQAGSNVTVFDTDVAGDVMPIIQGHRHVSDLLALMGSHVHLNNGPTQPLIVDSQGRLVAAHFLTQSAVRVRHSNPLCNNLFKGQTAKTQALSPAPHLGEWFLRLTYFQQQPSILDVDAITAGGDTITPVGGSQVLLEGRVGTRYLQLPSSQPVTIRVQGATPDTNVCLTSIGVGYPFAADDK